MDVGLTQYSPVLGIVAAVISRSVIDLNSNDSIAAADALLFFLNGCGDFVDGITGFETDSTQLFKAVVTGKKNNRIFNKLPEGRVKRGR